MNLKVKCLEGYLYDVIGVARRNLDYVTTGPKIGKSNWPGLELDLKQGSANFFGSRAR